MIGGGGWLGVRRDMSGMKQFSLVDEFCVVCYAVCGSI